mgnify:FL=1
MTILLALIACRQPTPKPNAAPILRPSVANCPAGVVEAVPSQGPVWGVSVVLPSGARVAPMVRVFSDQVEVFCPPEGGELTVEWGEQ